MAVNGEQPFIKVMDSNGDPIVGAELNVYEVGTTTFRDIFSDSGLTTPMTNPLSGVNASNASGDFPRFYMAAGTYKLRAETSAGALIWEYDDIDTGISAGAGALPVASGGTGATTAPAALANLGAASASEVTALAAQVATFASSLTTIVNVPQGRLTLTPSTPVLVTGVTAGTSVYYTPYIGNLCPIYDGAQFNSKVFAELTLTLNSNHVLSSIYDCFIIDDAGTIRIVTGPAWTTITAGSGARGTGAGTTELTRVNGLWVNANAMATARNGASTYSVAANQGTYVGSLFIDGTAGQISCLTAYGQARKWGVWNAYNRIPIFLKLGDTTASWTSTPTTWRQSRADANNFLHIFSGLPEEWYDLRFSQTIKQSVNNTDCTADIGIGYNSTTAVSGRQGRTSFSSAVAGLQFHIESPAAFYQAPPAIGINKVNIIEQAGTGTTDNIFFGTEALMGMTAQWRG